MSAKPLNVHANGKSPIASKPQEVVKTPAKTAAGKPEEISSPHELTAFVESLLSQLESKFDDMSSQVLDKMTAMSARVDSLEVAMQDLLNDTYVPGTPAPPPLPRSDSARSDLRGGQPADPSD